MWAERRAAARAAPRASRTGPRPAGRLVALAALGLPVLLALAGCAGRVPRVPVPLEPETSGVELRLRAEVAEWIGTPHCSRRSDEGCTDCSAFVAAVYAKLFQARLPGDTLAMSTLGGPIRPLELRAGDLVFFLVSRKTRHVGIYLRNGEFAHASSSRGVTVSRLDDPYWTRRFWQARRVL